ncbi:MAG TPA: transposase [Candidatus Dormibacteraeota bacterium]|nr:transposase [Candidatus Dormibacteraeota bacterium]
MPKGLKRIYGQGHLHFITFSCYRRLPLLRSARARNVFVRSLDRVRKEYGFKLVGYVVMPEHAHLLISEPRAAPPPRFSRR